ncbi:hypothetical protein [Bacillus salipaludis]|uniref:hypothetical protein n=1 Tax=Bacillus salipaludis TaxID=2547811 RepID=UPI002E1CDA7F|nr:hypothetical protein [Bacillus salipaludis]
MNRFIKWIPIVFVFLLLSACSSDSKSESVKMDLATSKTADSAKSGSQEKASLRSGENSKKESNQSIEIQIPEKKVIYTADLELRVKKF